MKYMKEREKYNPFNLQFFAGDGGDGEGAGDEDEQEEQEEDEGEEEEEKKFSQKDVDDAVKKRLAREKRKWQREQQKEKDGKDFGKDGKDESDDSKARKAAEDRASDAERRASKAEIKLACFEAGVAKDSVDDVVALAKSYMEADEDMDLEEAIEKVVKKYPHFKAGANQEDEEDKKKAWGERQRGKAGKMSGVEKAFYELNPDLKK